MVDGINEKAKSSFEALTRQEFRRYFQPSRIVLGVIPAPSQSGVNIITICFDMNCSYKPTMMAFAVQNISYSYDLLKDAEECVLAIPGESLAEQALFCGVESGRNVDKVAACGFTLFPSETVSVPGIEECLANLELKVVNKIYTGDHITIIGEVTKYLVKRNSLERCLLSVGPEHRGYEVIARKGIHRIGVVSY